MAHSSGAGALVVEMGGDIFLMGGIYTCTCTCTYPSSTTYCSEEVHIIMHLSCTVIYCHVLQCTVMYCHVIVMYCDVR